MANEKSEWLKEVLSEEQVNSMWKIKDIKGDNIWEYCNLQLSNEKTFGKNQWFRFSQVDHLVQDLFSKDKDEVQVIAQRLKELMPNSENLMTFYEDYIKASKKKKKFYLYEITKNLTAELDKISAFAILRKERLKNVNTNKKRINN